MKRTFIVVLAVGTVLSGCHRDKNAASSPGAANTTTSSGEQLTEGQVVGALVATNRELYAADSAAVSVVPSAGINLFATVLRSDHRAIAQEIQAVADSSKLAAQQSTTAERLMKEAQAIASAMADSATGDRGQAFLQAQVDMSKHMIGAMDSMFIPSAKTPMLRQVLQDLRPAMVAHLQRGEQLIQYYASLADAPHQAAARIPADSARVPGDTTAPGVAKPDSTKPPKPDTIHR